MHLTWKRKFKVAVILVQHVRKIKFASFTKQILKTIKSSIFALKINQVNVKTYKLKLKPNHTFYTIKIVVLN